MERDRYAPGTPSWVDLGSPDIDASAAFYSALFGWEVPEAPEGFGGYRIALLNGKAVAWTTYFDTADAAASAALVKDNGGTVMMEPMDVMDQGRMVIAMDPEGAAFGLWQAGAHTGAQLVNETGAMGWNELWTRDIDQAKAFYPAVLGFTVDDTTMPGYTIWQVDGQMVAGGMTMPDSIPAQVPAHWAVYFVVSDVDGAAGRVPELGGMVVTEPFDVAGVGRIAIVHGPAHESFGLFSSPNQT